MDEALEYGRAINFGKQPIEGYLEVNLNSPTGVNPNNRDFH